MTRYPDTALEWSEQTRRAFIRETTALGSILVLGGVGTGVVGAQDDDDETAETTEDNGAEGDAGQEFVVRIENVSEPGALMPSDEAEQDITLSPGVYAAFTGENPLFTSGEADRGDGLEALAEDGDPSTLAEALPDADGVVSSGSFDQPEDAEEAGPIGPDQTYEFDFAANSDASFTFATMYIQSNDLFFSPGEEGIALFEDDQPIDADVTDQIDLWDAGTEENEEPGVGENQPMRQAGPDTGPDEGGVVQPVSETDDGFTYPAATDVIRVTISPESEDVEDEEDEDETDDEGMEDEDETEDEGMEDEDETEDEETGNDDQRDDEENGNGDGTDY